MITIVRRRCYVRRLVLWCVCASGPTALRRGRGRGVPGRSARRGVGPLTWLRRPPPGASGFPCGPRGGFSGPIPGRLRRPPPRGAGGGPARRSRRVPAPPVTVGVTTDHRAPPGLISRRARGPAARHPTARPPGRPRKSRVRYADPPVGPRSARRATAPDKTAPESDRQDLSLPLRSAPRHAPSPPPPLRSPSDPS